MFDMHHINHMECTHQNLDLTAENRKLIHEGPLTWRIQHRKAVG